MKEYKMLKTRWRFTDTEVMLNSFADKGWEVVFAFSDGCFLLEREVKK